MGLEYEFVSYAGHFSRSYIAVYLLEIDMLGVPII